MYDFPFFPLLGRKTYPTLVRNLPIAYFEDKVIECKLPITDVEKMAGNGASRVSILKPGRYNCLETVYIFMTNSAAPFKNSKP